MGAGASTKAAENSGAMEFTYFKGAKARGHAMKIALFASGLEWKDTSLTFAEYMPLKKEGKFGSGLPVLKLSSGLELAQSMAIARFAAKQGKFDLYPADPLKAAVVDAVCDTALDIAAKLPGGASDEEKTKNRAAFLEGPGKGLLDMIVKALEKSDGPFFLGSRLSLADSVVCFMIVDGCQSGGWDFVPTDAIDKGWPKLGELAKAVKEHPLVKAFEEGGALPEPPAPAEAVALPEGDMEFTYFKGFKAKGQACRIALHASGLKWKDTSLTSEEFWNAKKEGKFPSGAPCLKLPNGDELAQSMAIARFAAKYGKAGLYPTDPLEAAVVDAVLDCAGDIATKMPGGADDEEKTKNRIAHFAEGAAKALMDMINKAVESSSGPFLLGNQLTLADLLITYFLVDNCQLGIFDFVPKDTIDKGWPKLVELAKAVQEHEVVKAYEASL